MKLELSSKLEIFFCRFGDILNIEFSSNYSFVCIQYDLEQLDLNLVPY